jgi:eukaryotic-like serine/threonine-protein kinase
MPGSRSGPAYPTTTVPGRSAVESHVVPRRTVPEMSKRTASLCPFSPPTAASRIRLTKALLGGKYELVRLIGQGSMGEVWQASHVTLRQQVAIKLLAASVDGIPIEAPEVASARFRFEAQIAARLSRRTRHIVRVTDHGEEDGIAYLVMELLEGHTLESFLMQRGCMSPAEVSALLAQIARGLAHAHGEGVVHRDLKPGNVFLTRDEDDRQVAKLLDFGIARMLRPHATGAFKTARGVVFGTPGYMSPEQTDASVDLDRQCDLWALATIAYEALSGGLPVQGFDVAELLHNVRARRFVPLRERCAELPRTLDAFFERAFAARVRDRFESAPELALAFEKATAEAEAAGGGAGAALSRTQVALRGPTPMAPLTPTPMTPLTSTPGTPLTPTPGTLRPIDKRAEHRRPRGKRAWPSLGWMVAAALFATFAALVGAHTVGPRSGGRPHGEARSAPGVVVAAIPGGTSSPGTSSPGTLPRSTSSPGGETTAAHGSALGQPAMLGAAPAPIGPSSVPPSATLAGFGAAAPSAVLPIAPVRKPSPALSPAARVASPSSSARAASPSAAPAPGASAAKTPQAPAPPAEPVDRSDVL